eukprot:1674371-Pleurochrysis_carterae.AAC.1
MARDSWCLWARKGLDALPHQRNSPCDRCPCGSCGRHIANAAHVNTHNFARTCGCAPLSSNCIAPREMAAQRAATLSRIDRAIQPCTRSVGLSACLEEAVTGGIAEEDDWRDCAAARAATCALSAA